MLVETGKKIFCLSLDTGKQSETFRPLEGHPGVLWTPTFGENTFKIHLIFLKKTVQGTCSLDAQFSISG